MKLQFKHQSYQAVEAVVDCFAGQPKVEGLSFRPAFKALNPHTNLKTL